MIYLYAAIAAWVLWVTFAVGYVLGIEKERGRAR